MKLIKGKFYNDKGVEIPVEAGNREQIRLLRIANRNAAESKEYGLEIESHLDVETVVVGRIKAVCTCGSHISKHIREEIDVADRYYDELEFLENSKVVCSSCERKYEIVYSDELEEYRLKPVNQKQ